MPSKFVSMRHQRIACASLSHPYLGHLPLVSYHPPGDLSLAEAVRKLAGKHHAVLLANHGPVVAGSSLDAAANAIEELEETAKLFLLLRGAKLRLLTPEQVGALKSI